MKRISLRTKMEAGFVILLMILISISNVSSVTRTISSTQDTVDTFIRNSNGKYWDATAWDAYLNIQAAIDELGTIYDGTKGYVWLPSQTAFEIYSTIEIDDNIVVDMQGATFEAVDDIDIVEMSPGCELRNGIITTIDNDLEDSGGFHSACIVFDAGETDNFGDEITTIENLQLESTNQNGTGVLFNCDGNGEFISFVTVRDVTTDHFDYGFHLNCSGGTSGSGSYINSNRFYNIKGDEDSKFIYLERNTGEAHGDSDVDGNSFYSFDFQSGTETECVVYTEGRYNGFNGFIWDWSIAGGSNSIEFSSDTQRCYSTIYGGYPDVVDSGFMNTFVDYEYSELDIETISAGNISISGDLIVSGSYPGSGDYDPTLIWNSNGNNWTATGANVQAAIDDLNLATYNASGAVYLPAGDITLTEPIIISNVSSSMGIRNLLIQGCGRATRLIGDGTFNIINITDAWHLVMKDLCVDNGYYGIYTGTIGVGDAAEHNKFCKFENVYATGCTSDGFHLTYIYQLSLHNCFSGNVSEVNGWGNGGDGFYIDSIEGGGAYSIVGGGAYGNSGCGFNITAKAPDWGGAIAISISGVFSEKNGKTGIRLYGGRCVSLSGCYVELSGEYSYWLGGAGNSWGGYEREGAYTYAFTMENCYARSKRVYVDAPWVTITGCYLRGQTDTYSLYGTDNANFLTLNSGKYLKQVYIDPLAVGLDAKPNAYFANGINGNQVNATSTYDNMIYNSNGNYWNATYDNIQRAIWDLNSTDGGTVYLPGNSSIPVYNTIILEGYVTLDMQGATLTNGANVDLIELTNQGRLIDGHIHITGTYTSDAINVTSDSESRPWRLVDNMYIQGTYGSGDRGTAIHLYGDQSSTWICGAMFTNLYIYGFSFAIKYDAYSNVWMNANIFDDIWIEQTHNHINMTRHGTGYLAGNYFTDIVIQPSLWTEQCVKLEDYSNYFSGFVWDFHIPYGQDNSRVPLKSVGSSNVFDCFITCTNFTASAQLLDDSEGYDTQFINRGISNGTTSTRMNLVYKFGRISDDYWTKDSTTCGIAEAIESCDIGYGRSSICNDNYGGIIYIPKGTYEITSGISLYFDNIVIQGAGVGSTIIKVADGTDSGFNMFGVSGDNCTIRDLTIDGNRDNQASGDWFAINVGEYAQGTRVQNVEMKNIRTYYGIKVFEGASRTTVEDCYIHDCGSGCQLIADNCTFTNNKINGSDNYDFMVHSSYTKDCIITNNIIENGLVQTTNMSRTGCVIKDNLGFDFTNYQYIPCDSQSPYASPDDGAMYFDITTHKLAVYYDGTWYYYSPD